MSRPVMLKDWLLCTLPMDFPSLPSSTATTTTTTTTTTKTTTTTSTTTTIALLHQLELSGMTHFLFFLSFLSLPNLSPSFILPMCSTLCLLWYSLNFCNTKNDKWYHSLHVKARCDPLKHLTRSGLHSILSQFTYQNKKIISKHFCTHSME